MTLCFCFCGFQAHVERDVGKERSVVQQPGFPLQPVHGARRSGPGETLGPGMSSQSNSISLCVQI